MPFLWGEIMQYKLSNDFTALSETSGIFYVMPGYSVEIATGDSMPSRDTGFVLRGGISFPFSSTKTIYARSRGGHATLNVTEGEFAAGASGGSGGGGGIDDDDIATDEEVDEIIDDIMGP